MSDRNRPYKHPFSSRALQEPPLENRIFGVLTLEELLAIGHRKSFLTQARIHCGAPYEYFESLYKKVIENFMCFVQHIPSLKNSRLSRLDRQLGLATAALSLREPYLLAGELFNRVIDQDKALWNYLVFTGLLLSRLGELKTQYEIVYCDEKGAVGAKWDPVWGALTATEAEYYRILQIQMTPSAINNNYHLLLAMRLMPAEGLAWIAQDPFTFEQWIICLEAEESHESPNILTATLEIIERWLNEWPEQGFEFNDSPSEDLDQKLQNWIEDPQGTERLSQLPAQIAVGGTSAELFLRWLREQTAAQTLSMNQARSVIFLTQDDVLLIHPALIERYCKQFRKETPEQLLHALANHPALAQLFLAKNESPVRNWGQQYPALTDPKSLIAFAVRDPKIIFGPGIPTRLAYIIQHQELHAAKSQLVQKELIAHNRQQEAQKKAQSQDKEPATLTNQQWPRQDQQPRHHPDLGNRSKW